MALLSSATNDGIRSIAVEGWLRRQVGVVLQENMLFNRSIRDNIALTDSALPLSAVIHGAKLAGAHDFIAELPEGYDTKVGEHGSGLSGGQRQRIYTGELAGALGAWTVKPGSTGLITICWIVRIIY